MVVVLVWFFFRGYHISQLPRVLCRLSSFFTRKSEAFCSSHFQILQNKIILLHLLSDHLLVCFWFLTTSSINRKRMYFSSWKKQDSSCYTSEHIAQWQPIREAHSQKWVISVINHSHPACLWTRWDMKNWCQVHLDQT